MFPSAPDITSERRGWRAAVRRAVDLVVAFATLEDPELDASVQEGWEAFDDDAREHLRGSARPAHHVTDPHPHRRPLRPAVRAGRPGAVPERPTPCVPAVSHRSRRSEHQRRSQLAS